MHFCATLYIPNNLHVTVLEQFFRRETIEMVTLDNSLYRFFLRSDRDVDTICKTQGECRCFHCNDIHETQDDFSEHVMETHSAAALVSPRLPDTRAAFNIPQNMTQIEDMFLRVVHQFVGSDGSFHFPMFESQLRAANSL
ncbi:hypothetical protein QR680_006853 [Steinernema hermaphroditum]|uniref:Uncharacterized protein n=1 Tax=Steinernema hermaphroditum TaxID=289476 RepID=A0AA39LXS1_9BILA|nr:hypothetical protein QR680_006853 [Steinernema hermaphroditum]